MRMIHVCSLLIAFVLLLTASAVLASVPAPTDPRPLPPAEQRLWLEGGPEAGRDMPAPLGPFNYLREFDQIAAFLADWQELDIASPDYGGMIEAESGDLADIIQTDNTLEAIWVWSRYRELTGRTTYDANVAAAWEYSLAFPAWLEEGGAGNDYYRVHNCAWGLTAVLQYVAATGDDSYDDYAETCAGYIRTHSLSLTGDAYTQRLNAFCKGWAVGNLYLYGEAAGSLIYQNVAVNQGQDVLDWLNTYPPNYLTFEYWAMSSGTAAWGVCNSVFRADPSGGEAWLLDNAQYLDLWQDWYNVPGYDWDSSWNVAYLNAHFAVWDLLDDATYWQNAVNITDALLSLDTDDDGGIQADTTSPDTEDMCWVTSYLVKFGVDRLIGEPADHDVGVLRLAGLDDGQEFASGEAIPLRVLATNYGLGDESGVTLRLTVDGPGAPWTEELTVDLPFAALDTVTFDAAWQPIDGLYQIEATTLLAGDEQAANDTVEISIQVGEPTAVGDAVAPGFVLLGPDRNPFDGAVGFGFRLGEATPVAVEVFDLRGRKVAALSGAGLGAGDHRLEWNGRDQAGRMTPAGTYLYRIEAGHYRSSGKLIKLR